MTRVFDTSTIEGLKKAERFQSKLYDLYDSVTVRPIGLDRVQIVGRNPVFEDDIERARR